MQRPIPPDPEEMNEDRSDWAEQTLQFFSSLTGTAFEGEALGDLLADLRHLCDRRPDVGDFDSKVMTSGDCYLDEVAAPGTLYGSDETLAAEYAQFETDMRAFEALEGEDDDPDYDDDGNLKAGVDN